MRKKILQTMIMVIDKLEKTVEKIKKIYQYIYIEDIPADNRKLPNGNRGRRMLLVKVVGARNSGTKQVREM